MRYWIGFTVAALALPVSAQTAAPVPIMLDAPASANLGPASPHDADGQAFACYAIQPPAGTAVVVRMSAPGFAGRLQLARGALCPPAAPLQSAQANAVGESVTLKFSAAGGRYLIVMLAPAGAQGRAILTAAPALTEVAQLDRPADIGEAPALPPAVDSRRALMQRQVAARDAELARIAEEKRLAEERRRRQEEAARRRAEEAEREAEYRREQAEANSANTAAMIFGAINGAFQQATEDRLRQQEADRRFQQQVANAQRRQDALQAERSAAAAAERAASDARQAANLQAQRAALDRQAAANAAAAQARQQAADAQQRQQQSVSRAAAAPSPSGSQIAMANPERSAPAAPEVITMLEGVVVCPTEGDPKLFGEAPCHGPFQTTLSDHRKASDIAMACGKDLVPSDYGMYGRYHVWGCGYGINPRKPRSPNNDQAARFGLTIPQRRSYRCPVTIFGYCQ